MTVRSVFVLVLGLGLGILTTARGTEDLGGTHELTYGGRTVEVPKKAEKILFDSVAYPVEDAMALELPVLYEDAGFSSPISAASVGQTISLSPETLSSIDPDYLFVEGYWSEFPVDMREEVERLKEREGWQELTAVQEGRVYAFEEAQVVSGTMSAQSYSRMTLLKQMTEEMNR